MGMPRCSSEWQPRPQKRVVWLPATSASESTWISNHGTSRQTATPTEFQHWRRKFEQYYLGSDLGVTHIPGQQAALVGCVDGYIEQHLYSMISDNTPIFTPKPNEVKIQSCMDFIYNWITERHPMDTRRMELFKLSQEQG